MGSNVPVSLVTMSPAQIETRRLTGDEKRAYVRSMFTSIAPRYDLLNHLLSFNIDRSWRKTAINSLRWQDSPAGHYLDLCAGTLDLAAELSSRDGFGGQVIGADFVIPMLRLGRCKARVAAVGADALSLPFADGRFDGCTVGFGVRNLTDLDGGFREIARVLKRGGRLVVLDFCTPTTWPLRPLYMLYFRHILPWVGRTVSRHSTAYSYLPESVVDFPSPVELVERMEQTGFAGVGFRRLTGGISVIHWGNKIGN